MPELVAEELEEAVELVGVAAQCRGQRGGVGFRRLERADVELEAVAEAVDPPEDADGVSLAEPAVEERDIAPDPRLDPAARVYELEREVIGAGARAPPLLPGHCVDALDNAVLLELGDSAHGPSLGTKTDGTLVRDGRSQAVSRLSLRRGRRGAARPARRPAVRRHRRRAA